MFAVAKLLNLLEIIAFMKIFFLCMTKKHTLSGCLVKSMFGKSAIKNADT